MKEELHWFSAFYDSVTPAVRYVMRDPRFSGRVYVPIAAIYYTVRTTVLVMELTVWTHFITKFISTCTGKEPGLVFW